MLLAGHGWHPVGKVGGRNYALTDERSTPPDLQATTAPSMSHVANRISSPGRKSMLARGGHTLPPNPQPQVRRVLAIVEAAGERGFFQHAGTRCLPGPQQRHITEGEDRDI
ncbi:MAG: hypothetical protein ACTHL5_12375 [Rhodanobacter sp.]